LGRSGAIVLDGPVARRAIVVTIVARSRSPADLPGWLTGKWTARREINGGAGAFTGTAVFGDDGAGGLLWHEAGRLALASHTGAAARTYLIVADGAGAWEVRFSDGRPFHRLDLSGGRWEAAHHCGEDVYRGVYEVTGPDDFAVTWRVSGPRKDDLIACAYARC
jgi:hypothetical protein